MDITVKYFYIHFARLDALKEELSDDQEEKFLIGLDKTWGRMSLEDNKKLWLWWHQLMPPRRVR